MNQQAITDLTKLAGAFEVVANRFTVSSAPPNSHGFFLKASGRALELADWYLFPSADLVRHQELKATLHDLCDICDVMAGDNSLTPHGRQFWSDKIDELGKLITWHDNQIARQQRLSTSAVA